MQQITLSALPLLMILFVASCATTGPSSGPAAGDIPPPPIDAPEGYRWVLVEALSDEFHGSTLDRDKWIDHYPGWEGRVPGKFVPESLSVKDGLLHITSTVLDPPRGEDGEWTIACGALQSRAMTAHYGYYEARVKASNVRTSTTFWMKNDRGQRQRPYKITELDVLEAVGHAGRWPSFATQMKSNTHIEYFPEDPEAEPVNLKKGGNSPLPDGGRVHDRFRTYGCWWVDAKTMHFYVDGEWPTPSSPPPSSTPPRGPADVRQRGLRDLHLGAPARNREPARPDAQHVVLRLHPVVAAGEGRGVNPCTPPCVGDGRDASLASVAQQRGYGR